jgi:hypothetical protein
MVADEPAGEADQDWREVVRHGRSVTLQMAEVAVAAHDQGHPDAYCPASGAARTSVSGAEIECDRQRRQGCVTKGGNKFYARRGGNPLIPLPAAPIAVRLLPRTPKNQTMAFARPQSEENLFLKCELPRTSRPIPERYCFETGRIGAFIWRMPVPLSLPLGSQIGSLQGRRQQSAR